MIVLSLLGKFGALFTTIPDPIIGGIFIVMFGMITSVGLSSLQYVSLDSVRNLFVLGSAIFMGMVIPNWVKLNQGKVSVGKIRVGFLFMDWYAKKSAFYTMTSSSKRHHELYLSLNKL